MSIRKPTIINKDTHTMTFLTPQASPIDRKQLLHSIAASVALAVLLGALFLVMGALAGFSRAEMEVCVPDPVLCPVPKHAQATETVAFPLSGERVPLLGLVIWGTATLELLDTDQNTVGVFLGWRDLHGHNWMEPQPAKSLLADATFHDRYRGLRDVCNASTRDNRCIVRLTYSYATSDEREFVLTPDSVFHAARWGRHHPERGTKPDSTLDVQPILAHVVNVVARYRASAPPELRGVTPTIVLPPGTYQWDGSISLAFPVNIRGSGGAEVVEAQTTVEVNGETVTLEYRPTRRVSGTKTHLKRRSGAVGDFLRSQLDADDPYYAPAPQSLALGTGRMAMFYVHRAGSGTAIRDLICDGNLYERVEGVEGPDGASSLEIQQHISDTYPGESDWRGPILDTARNTPSDACFVVQNHAGVEVRDGTIIYLDGVEATGVASSYLGKIGATFWHVRRSMGGDNTINHVTYCAGGDYKDFTHTGFSWDHHVECPIDMTKFPGHVRRNVNITFERLRANPVRYNKGLIEVRRSDFALDSSFVDLRTPDEEDGSPSVLNTFVYQEPHAVRISNTVVVSKAIRAGGYDFGLPGLVRDAREHVVYDGVTAYLDRVNTFVGPGRGPVYIRNSTLNVLDSSERMREFGHRGSGRLYLLDNVKTNARFDFFSGSRDYSAPASTRVCLRETDLRARRPYSALSGDLCERYFHDAERLAERHTDG